MSTLHRVAAALTSALALTAVTVAAPLGASAAPARATRAAPPAAAPAAATASVPASCTSVRELGTKAVVTDLGMSAFTVRQFIGWCTDGAGSAWMNFASVYVWQQYHDSGIAYRGSVGVVVSGEPESRGFVTGALRDRLTYSAPVRTTTQCTQGWGKLVRSGGESGQGLSSRVC